MIGNTQIASQNEYYITGLALAQSILDEAKTKAFDQNTATKVDTVVPRAGMTSPTLLNHEPGENVPSPDFLTPANPYGPQNQGYFSAVKFNDIDDYNGYSRLVNTPRAENYKLLVTVNYASETFPDSNSAIGTYCKKMTVKVTSPYFPKRGDNGGPDTLSVSYAFTY